MTNLSDIEGYFGAKSMSWRLYREPVVLLGGFRALILQIAHPAVADGVARYSNFRADALGRGFRTFKAMATIYFGTRTEAEATAARLYRMHRGIRGEGYTANDANLQVWVWATLTDTTLRVFEPFAEVLNLPPDWQTRFYTENLLMANILGISVDDLPADLAAFDLYISQQLSESGVLGTTPACKELTDAILGHQWVYRPWGELLTSGWMPAHLCQRLGVPLQADDRLPSFFRRAARVYRWVPKGLRYSPAYHQAHGRIAEAAQQRAGLWARFFWWLGKRVSLPLGI